LITLGLGVFGLGPRARAELWLTLTPAAAGIGPGAPLVADWSDADRWSSPENDRRRGGPLNAQGLHGSSGCSSSPSTPVGVGVGSSALAGEGAFGLVRPDLFGLLRLDETLLNPSAPVGGIFEPPRLSLRCL